MFRPEKEVEVAEKHGLGIMTGSTFTIKHALRDNIRNICVPRATQTEVIGTITHVSKIKR